MLGDGLTPSLLGSEPREPTWQAFQGEQKRVAFNDVELQLASIWLPRLFPASSGAC